MSSTSYEVEGTLHKVFDTEQKSGTFQTRDFVILMEAGQYPQHIKFQLAQDRCEIIDHHSEGDQIKVYFDLRGREWQGKYFTNLNAWRIEKTGAVKPKKAESVGAESAVTEPTGADPDLPF